MLEVRNLSKTYSGDGQDFRSLSDVDLKIGNGECVAIVGKSGSGKSTLMHVLACLDEPTEGSVMVDGSDISLLSERAKNTLRNENFGFVFQQFFLNGRDTVFENVALPLRIRGADMAELRSGANTALGAVGLSDKINKKAKDLSGGEKQRVCIARALVGSPHIIFADEPSGNLDSKSGADLLNFLRKAASDYGQAIVMVTHDSNAAAYADRVVMLKDGKIVDEITKPTVDKILDHLKKLGN